MSCQKCVAKITAALQAVDGVIAVVVSLEDKLGRVQVADGGPDREQLLSVVIEAGFQVVAPVAEDEVDAAEGRMTANSVTLEATSTSIFALQGMTCANCAQDAWCILGCRKLCRRKAHRCL